MTSPGEALARARRAAADKRARGGYADVRDGADALDATIHDARPPAELLSEWAVIEIEPEVMYSTRRGGAPITALKRLLLRFMRQHLVELEARQTRFNFGVLAALQELEKRVERLDGAPLARPAQE